MGTGPRGGSDCPPADPTRARRNAAKKARKERGKARMAAEDAQDPEGAGARAFAREREAQKNAFRGTLLRNGIDAFDL